jgi:hypothetical protein
VHDVVCVPWTDPSGDIGSKKANIDRFAEQVISVVGGG